MSEITYPLYRKQSKTTVFSLPGNRQGERKNTLYLAVLCPCHMIGVDEDVHEKLGKLEITKMHATDGLPDKHLNGMHHGGEPITQQEFEAKLQEAFVQLHDVILDHEHDKK